MSDDRLFLTHIQECLKRIAAYTVGGETEFRASTLVQDAVLRNLQTLAESTQRLSDPFKAAHSHVDWRGIAGFRNILVHGYLGIDIGRVWAIIERDVPELHAVVDAALAE
ncbi:MAG: DUF86 domain-containing protein [Pirellulales bacterium]